MTGVSAFSLEGGSARVANFYAGVTGVDAQDLDNVPVPGPGFAQARHTVLRAPAVAQGDNGDRHFESLWGSHDPLSFVSDNERIEACALMGA